MSDKMALRQIIEIAAAALAAEGEEDETETEGEESEDGMQAEDEAGETEEVTPAAVRATALRIRGMRDAE
jgi:hypothetical protein